MIDWPIDAHGNPRIDLLLERLAEVEAQVTTNVERITTIEKVTVKPDGMSTVQVATTG